MDSRAATRFFALAAVAAGAGCAQRTKVAGGAPPKPKPAETTISDGRSLLAAMRRTQGGTWYRTLSFTQNNILYATTGRETRSQWIEHARVPGRLRIDYLPLSMRSGVLYDGSRVHVFDNGRALNAQPGINVYMLLTADVYLQPDTASVRQLAAEGFDLSRARHDRWQGQAAWVVGAAAGDSSTNQFWVSSDKLLLLRVIQQEKRGARAIVTEARFADYRTVDGFPVPHEIQLRRDGRLYFREDYADVKVNVELDPAMFDPARWAGAQPKG